MIFSKDTKTIRLTIFILDIFITIVSFIVALALRMVMHNAGLEFEFSMEMYLIIFIISILTWIIFLKTHNPIPLLPHYSFKDVIYDMIKKVIMGIIIILSISFLIKGIIISRLFLIMFGIVNIIFLIIERRLFFLYKRNKYRKGINLAKVLIIGNPKNAEKIVNIISSHRDWGIELINVIPVNDLEKNGFPEKFKSMHVDMVIFTISGNNLEMFNKYIPQLMSSGVKTMLYLDSLIKAQDAFIEQQSFLNIDFLTFSSNKEREISLYFKYIFDKLFSLFLIIILFPFFGVIALISLMVNGKPIFFKQERVGYNGKTFNIYKFRTMCKNAEHKKNDLIHKNIMSGPVFKMKNDPRVTIFGKLLRRWSIDELPQLINILKGDMSFVGPRPPLSEEVEKYKLWQRRRLSMRPGLTCTWQISGRNSIDFIDWMYMDMEYIDHWSILYDIIIIAKTIPIVISGKGNV